MVLITGKYQNVKDENLLPYLQAVGFAPDLIEKAIKPGLVADISEEGNNHCFKTGFGITISYTLNEEFDEPSLKNAKSIVRREGDKIIVDTKTSHGLFTTRVFEFTETGFTVIFTVDDIVAKRYYKKL